MAKYERRSIAVHLPASLHAWVASEAKRRKCSRSRLIFGALEVYRVLESAGTLGRAVRKLRDDALPIKPRANKLRDWMAGEGAPHMERERRARRS